MAILEKEHCCPKCDGLNGERTGEKRLGDDEISEMKAYWYQCFDCNIEYKINVRLDGERVTDKVISPSGKWEGDW